MNRHNGNGRTAVVSGGAIVRTPVFITALVSSLAVCGTIGCSSGGHSRVDRGDNFTQGGLAAHAEATIDPNAAKGSFTSEWYEKQAGQVGLPEQWLGEAEQATATNEARRAAAQAAQVVAQADQSEGFSRADADRQAALTREQVAQANANQMKDVYSAKLTEMERNTAARQVAVEADAKHRTEMLAVQVMQWHGEVEKIRSQAGADWSAAQAEHMKMLAERTGVAGRGRAQIDQMIKVADLTQSRAISTVAALRAEGKATAEKTAAQADELTQRIKTTREQSQASLAELRQRTESVRQESAATGNELRARAEALEEQDVNETYRLSVTAAESEFLKNKAEAERLFQTASAMEQSTAGEAERRRSEARKDLELDRADYEGSLASIQSFVEHGKAEIAANRVHALKVERDARAEFIRTEVEAGANALREQARQQFVLAEEEAKKIRAQAEATAAKLRAEFVEAFARQRKNGEAGMPAANASNFGDNAAFNENNATGNRSGASAGRRNNENAGAARPGRVSSNDPNPELTRVGARRPVLEPEHVAAFKSALGEAQKLRMQADADEMALFATAGDRAGAFEAWWKQQMSKFDAATGDAESFEKKAKADIARQNSEGESRMKQASVGLDRAKSEAEANRRETLASIVNLRADADLVEKKAGAMLTQLAAQTIATDRNAESELRSLAVILTSTRQRGDATSRKLMAEADAVERHQNAVVAQMREEIESARQILSSELARLQQAADSYLAIADATNKEAVALADALDRVTETNATEMVVGNEATRKIAQADIEYMKDLAGANRLVADAAVARAVADAQAEFGQFESQDMSRRAQITARGTIAGAAASTQFAIADAHDQAAASLFGARIAMTEADRNRAFAEQYLNAQQSRARTQQALAAAAAYREMSNAALARLNDQSKAFEQAANKNWNSALAMPGALPTPENPGALYRNADQLLNPDPNNSNRPVAGVPTNNPND